MTLSYGRADTWVLADDNLSKWPEQFAALPDGSTVIVPGGDDRYYATEEVDPRLKYLTWAEARSVSRVWDERLAGKEFDFRKAKDRPGYRARWPGRYPPRDPAP